MRVVFDAVRAGDSAPAFTVGIQMFLAVRFGWGFASGSFFSASFGGAFDAQLTFSRTSYQPAGVMAEVGASVSASAVWNLRGHAACSALGWAGKHIPCKGSATVGAQLGRCEVDLISGDHHCDRRS